MKHETQTTHTQPSLPLGDPPAAGKDPGQTPDADQLAALRAENERLRKELQTRDAHTSLKDKLKRAGARTPKLLVEAAKHALEFTAAGELANAVEIIEALKEKFPEQFGGHSPAPVVRSIDAGAGRVAKPGLTREALAKMKPAEVAELNWEDVRRVLAAK